MLLNGTTYHEETPLEVAEAIEQARALNARIRVWYGKDGVSWNIALLNQEEYNTIGYVGRSTGTIKIPLLIYNRRSLGGCGLLDHCIVKIQDVKTKHVLYVHPKFAQDYFRADDTIVWMGKPGINQQIYASCKTPEQAQRLADFMNGERFSK